FHGLLLVSIGYLCYRGYDWWKLREQQKALFVYLTQKSPVVKRIPQDAFAYANLINFRRINDDRQGTRFGDVLNHWLDTGMSNKQKSNSMLGGILEKTILNVIGEEIAIAAVPSSQRLCDLVAVARLASGSDLLLNWALAAAKHTEKIAFQ